jgi:hypothetical protein
MVPAVLLQARRNAAAGAPRPAGLPLVRAAEEAATRVNHTAGHA